MSRVAKKPILVPENVTVSLKSNKVTIKGEKGTLELLVHNSVDVAYENNQFNIRPKEQFSQDKQSWAQAGTTRALINNMVEGVSKGFEKKLQLVGVGYRAQLKGKALVFNLGYSHPIEMNLPPSLTVELVSQTEIVLKGIDKQVLGQTAANIRGLRLPEPYKGKGVRYADERLFRKEAKKK